MILKNVYKAFVYSLLWGAIVLQLIALSLYSPYKAWLSPVLFKISRYYLARLELDLQSASFRLDPKGSIYMDEALCYVDKKHTIALSLKEAQLTIHLSSKNPLQGAKLSFKELSICHQEEEGLLPHPVFSLKDLGCTFKGETILMDKAHLAYGPLTVYLKGTLEPKSLFPKALNPSASLGSILSLACSFQNHLENLSDPLGWAYFEQDDLGSHLNFVVGANRPRNVDEKTASKASIQGALHFYEKQAHTALLRFQWPEFETQLGDQQTLKLDSIDGAIACSDLSKLKTLQIDAFAKAVSLNQEPLLGHLHASLEGIEGPWMRLNLDGVDGDSWMMVKLQVNPQDKRLFASVRASLEEPIFRKRILSSYFPERSYLKKGLLLDTKLSLGAEYCFENAEGSLQTTNCCFIDIPLNCLYANFAISPEQVAITQASFRHPDCTGEGAYYQNLSTGDYRFLLKGSLNPHLITPVMDPWWKDLWADFDLSQAWPEADVDVQGNWDQQSTSFVYGYGKAKDFAFRTAPLDSCSLYFWAAPLYLQLFDLELAYQSHTAKALIDWLYAPEDPDNYYAIVFDARSDISLKHLALILASCQVNDLAEAFTCTSPPELEGKGVLYGQPAILKHKDRLQLQCQALEPLKYEGVDLAYLSFRADKQGEHTAVSSLYFGLAGGKASGSMEVDSLPSKTALAFDLTLEDSDYDALRQVAAYREHFKADKNTPQALDEARVEEGLKAGGRAYLQAKGQGLLGNFKSFQVEGLFKLKDSNLGQLHLLGQFSKTLKLGSFDFKDIKAQFTLDQGVFTLPKLSIWGNTARMEGKGLYSLIEDSLDFSLHLYLLGGLKIPLFSHIFKIIDPLSKVSFIKLRGSLDNPEWQVKLSPFAVFQ